MALKTKKKDSPKKTARKPSKVLTKAKRINWSKYFGKIEFPADALTYQRRVRDEWST